MRTHVEDSTQLALSHAWDNYVQRNRKALFWESYRHLIAVAPLAVVLIVVLVFDPNESIWFWRYFVLGSFGWFVFVTLYATGVSTRSLFARYPRCRAPNG